jgi:protein-disulfide isomerase
MSLRQNTGWMRVVAILVMGVSVFVAPACGQACHDLQPATKSRISTYVSKQFGLPIGAKVALTKSVVLPDSCVHQLTYSVDWPKKVITLFLSPDERYFSTAVFDLTATPVARNIAPSPVAQPNEPKISQRAIADLVKDSASRGSSSAPVTIIEFSDFECPYCKGLTDILGQQVLPKEGSNVRLVFKQFPLSIHPWAQDAAEMSECVRQQDEKAFWQVHDFLFSHQTSLRKENLQREVVRFLANEPAVKLDAFSICVNQHKTREKVSADAAEGQRLGVRGTPTYFINGIRADGARPAETLERMIDAAKGGQNGSTH